MIKHGKQWLIDIPLRQSFSKWQTSEEAKWQEINTADLTASNNHY